MPDYTRGKIYSLRTYQSDEVYVGSTCQTLCQRLADHKRDYKSWKNGKHNYVCSFKLLEFDDCYIELLELYPCNSREELCKREGHYIREMDCLNKRIEGRSRKEYYQQNKEKINQYQKEYNQQNKEKLVQQQKEWREDNKQKIKEYYQQNKEHLLQKQKEYQKDNKDKIKKYYEDNKDKILEKLKEYRQQNRDKNIEKITCQCGVRYTKRDKKRHERSMWHQEYLMSLECDKTK